MQLLIDLLVLVSLDHGQFGFFVLEVNLLLKSLDGDVEWVKVLEGSFDLLSQCWDESHQGHFCEFCSTQRANSPMMLA